MGAFDDLARTLKDHMARAAADAPHALHFKVLRAAPLSIESMDGDLILTEGDPDLDIEAWVAQYHRQYGIERGDVVLVKRVSGGWAVTGVVDAKPVEEWAT